jgi:hypothetical protein
MVFEQSDLPPPVGILRGKLKNLILASFHHDASIKFYRINYYFLWAAQRVDLPDAKFLHALPACVLAEHFAFFMQITSS